MRFRSNVKVKRSCLKGFASTHLESTYARALGEQKATKSLGDVEMCKKKHENMLSIEAASKATRERETCLMCLENHNSFLIMGVDCGALHLGADVFL